MVHIFANVLLGMNAMKVAPAGISMNVNEVIHTKKISVLLKVGASRILPGPGLVDLCLSVMKNNLKPVEEEICSDTEGSYECICDTGYELKGTKCIDINECLYDRCPPIYNCVNSIGSYFCDCTEGFAYNTVTKEGFSSDVQEYS